jgi:tRNA-Thr(GGU) m(6)t(6)A37 methyltransferase TsaA
LAEEKTAKKDRMTATLEYIGHINTPYKAQGDCPRNIDPDGPSCKLVINEDMKDGLHGLNTGQEILILYWFEDVNRDTHLQKSPNNGKRSGVFALRSPHRPNPIGAAVAKIESIECGGVFVRGLDCLDGTPLLDIKPAILCERT